MTNHGSWYPSQTAHFAESFAIWFLSWMLAMWAFHMDVAPAGWAATWVVFCANTLAEGKSIGNRMRRTRRGVFHEVHYGDWIDYVVHSLGWMLPMTIIYGLPVLWGWLG